MRRSSTITDPINPINNNIHKSPVKRTGSILTGVDFGSRSAIGVRRQQPQLTEKQMKKMQFNPSLDSMHKYLLNWDVINTSVYNNM